MFNVLNPFYDRTFLKERIGTRTRRLRKRHTVEKVSDAFRKTRIPTKNPIFTFFLLWRDLKKEWKINHQNVRKIFEAKSPKSRNFKKKGDKALSKVF